MGQSIDRRGVDSVISGYEKFHGQSGHAYFSVWQGKILKFAHMDNNLDEGIELLRENLEAIEQSQTKALYTLRVHKTTDKDSMISDRTETYGSFNFVVYDELGLAQQGTGRNDAYQAHAIQQLQNEIKELREEKESGLSGMEPDKQFIMQILQEPIVQQIGSFLIEKLTGSNNPPPNNNRPPQQRQGFAGVHTRDRVKDEATVVDAINRIYAVDPDFPDVIKKIAYLAENDPDKYKMAKALL